MNAHAHKADNDKEAIIASFREVGKALCAHVDTCAHPEVYLLGNNIPSAISTEYNIGWQTAAP